MFNRQYDPDCTDRLSQTIEQYLEIRRMAGFELKVQAGLLRNFARFANDRGETVVRRQSALEWAALAPSPSQREHRLAVVRLLADHARAEDATHDHVPRHVFAASRRRPLPYLFSPDELRRLLEATSLLRPGASIRPQTYGTLLGLLASTGLRISEALGLTLDDVTVDGLVVRQTKFHKSRLVPLHQTAAAALERYLTSRRSLGGIDDHVFISHRGGRLTYPMVNNTFHYLLHRIGLDPKPDRRSPRIHDLRHLFAVHALENGPAGHEPSTRHMVALSTYLGHVHVTDTYWYLQATGRLMRSIADACETAMEGKKP